MNTTGKIVTKKNYCLEWSVVRHPQKGEKVSGDNYLVKEYKEKVLVTAVDGLGHGKAALEAANTALTSLNSFKDQSPIYLVNQCHGELKNTRGVVMSLAIFNSEENTMAWIGVGNVEGVLYRENEGKFEKEETILLRGGVVGYKLPLLKASMVSILPGDLLIFATDGVSYEFANKININRPTKEIVQFIASNYVDYSDDAQILVARYTGT